MEKRTTPATVNPETGELVVQVPNEKIARLVQLGVHAQRAERHKQVRRRMERQARRRNRRKH
jgi:hypothetical protein